MAVMEEKRDEKVPVPSPKPTVVKKRRKHKPKDFPKRPLSAYNIFFKETREELLAQREKEVGKDNVDFQSMVKEIAARWKTLGEEGKGRVDSMAKKDLQRYKEQVREYEDEMVRKSQKEREELAEKKKDDEKATQDAVKVQQDRHAAERIASGAFGASADLDRSRLSGKTPAEQQLILEQELRNLDAARELKLRQLQLVKMQMAGAGGPSPAEANSSNIASSLGRVSSGHQAAELEMMRARQLGLGAAGFGFSAGAGLPYSAMSSFPGAGGFHFPYPGNFEGNEAFMRGYSREEQEMLASRFARPSGTGGDFMGAYGASREAMMSNELLRARRLAAEQSLSAEDLYARDRFDAVRNAALGGSRNGRGA